mmetsp:Transcript_35843/g.57961  ORF Transcript_35843/g.57961 Transcript_35843/m.57961 type:complete len:679 (+) Transcript_35843:240-2276(+)
MAEQPSGQACQSSGPAMDRSDILSAAIRPAGLDDRSSLKLKFLAMADIERNCGQQVARNGLAGRRATLSGFSSILRSDIIDEMILETHRAESTEDSIEETRKESDRLLEEAVGRLKLLFLENEDLKLRLQMKECEVSKAQKETEAAVKRTEDLEFQVRMLRKNDQAMRSILRDNEQVFQDQKNESSQLKRKLDNMHTASVELTEKIAKQTRMLDEAYKDIDRLEELVDRYSKTPRSHRIDCKCKGCRRKSLTDTTSGVSTPVEQTQEAEDEAREAVRMVQLENEQKFNMALEEKIVQERTIRRLKEEHQVSVRRSASSEFSIRRLNGTPDPQPHSPSLILVDPSSPSLRSSPTSLPSPLTPTSSPSPSPPPPRTSPPPPPLPPPPPPPPPLPPSDSGTPRLLVTSGSIQQAKDSTARFATIGSKRLKVKGNPVLPTVYSGEPVMTTTGDPRQQEDSWLMPSTPQDEAAAVSISPRLFYTGIDEAVWELASHDSLTGQGKGILDPHRPKDSLTSRLEQARKRQFGAVWVAKWAETEGSFPPALVSAQTPSPTGIRDPIDEGASDCELSSYDATNPTSTSFQVRIPLFSSANAANDLERLERSLLETERLQAMLDNVIEYTNYLERFIERLSKKIRSQQKSDIVRRFPSFFRVFDRRDSVSSKSVASADEEFDSAPTSPR